MLSKIIILKCKFHLIYSFFEKNAKPSTSQTSYFISDWSLMDDWDNAPGYPLGWGLEMRP
jgi:hypothetical protein